MGNIKIYVSLVDGSMMPLVEDKTSEETVFAFTGDNTGAPPSSLTIEVTTQSGIKVKIYIPNSHAEASVTVDGKRL